MDDKILNDKNKLKIFVSLLIVVLLVMGVSFAIFQNFTRQSSTNNLGATNCFSISFEGVSDALNLENDYPIPDKEGLQRDPYTFKVTNTCDSYLSLVIGVETLSTSEIPASLIKGVIKKSGITPTSATILSSGNTMEAQNGGVAYELLKDGIGAKTFKTYDLRLWFDESMTKEQGATKKYQGKVIISSTADIETPRNLREAILADNEVKEPLTIPGQEVSAHTLDDVTTTSTASVSSTYQAYYFTYGTGWEANGTKFNLTGTAVTSDTYANSYSSLVGKYFVSASASDNGSSTAGAMKTTTNLSGVYYVVRATSSSFTYKVISSNKNATEALLASTEDDYGTSYYFRGAVTNNYVEFANKCWRIVRIGGDNTVKLILHNDNISNASNPCSSANNSTTAAFARHSESSYKSAFNSSYNDNAYVGFMYGTPGSTTYEATHANTNKSTILTNLETWYNNNLKTYESVIDNNVFCNDKSLSSGLGYSAKATDYAARERLYTSKIPSLKCNGELSKITSKIGLITADELAFAGYAVGSYITTSYLKENATGYSWWSLSPAGFYNQSLSYVFRVRSDNDAIDISNVNVDSSVRPVISLISSTSVTGNGTSDNPYVVQ